MMNSRYRVTGSMLAAACATAAPTASAADEAQYVLQAPAEGILLSSGAADDLTRQIELRCDGPCELNDPAILLTVFELRDELATHLGNGVRFVVEETRDPEEPEASTIFLIAQLPDTDEADAMLDDFIETHWSKQPVEVRGLIRIGREFV